MVTTKKTHVEYTQKGMRRKSKHVTTKKKNQLNTKEGSNRGYEGQKKRLSYKQKTNSKMA